MKNSIGIICEASLKGAQDLVIEILSPSSGTKDLDLGRKTYPRFGIQEYWKTDPESEPVEVLVWSETGYRSGGSYKKSDCLPSPLLPGLNLPLSAVFA